MTMPMEDCTEMKLLNRMFGHPEEINGGDRCPTYLYRWIVFGKRKPLLPDGRKRREPPFKVYIHRFVADDWSMDLHDHPKRFISIGLKGGYIEWSPCTACGVPCGFREQKIFNAPWIRSFPAEHIHRLSLFQSHPDGAPKDCWTLVIVLRGQREWGFWHLGRFIHWRSYVMGEDSHIADEMKSCGGDE